MSLIWNPFGLTGVVAWLLCWAMAALVYFAAPSRAMNRWLSVVLFFDGAAATGGVGLIYMLDDPAQVYGMQSVQVTAALALPWLYLLFLSTLNTPLVATLRHGFVRFIIVGAMFVVEAFWFTNPSAVIADIHPANYAPYDARYTDAWFQIGWVFVGVQILGALAAYDLFRRTPPGSAVRPRAKAFATAFVTRDVLFIVLSIWFLGRGPTNPGDFWGMALLQAASLPLIIFVLLASYGILTAHLFDIDIKIKWGIKQSTVAAAFIAVFFIASEAAQQFFASSLGPYVGIVAAGALVFALSPLQRAADKVANAAMPQVQTTVEYLTYKKLEVYRATIEGALEDGEITQRERTMLERLRVKLGISEADARALETDLAGARVAA